MITVSKVVIEKFMNHKKTTLTFPSTGLIVITGPNGAGKSSCLEAISFCLWGKTLRGTDPWPSDDGGRILVQLANGMWVERNQTKSIKGRVLFAGGRNEDPISFATMTKAQETLDSKLCSFDCWSKSSIFSSADAATYSDATDMERKLLLEGIIGLDGCSNAHELCKADLKSTRPQLMSADSRVALVQSKIDLANQQVRAASTRLEECSRSAPQSATLEATKAKLAKQQESMRKLERQIEHDTNVHSEMQARVYKAQFLVKNTKASLDAATKQQCEACGQTIVTDSTKIKNLQDALAASTSELESLLVLEQEIKGEIPYNKELRAELKVSIDKLLVDYYKLSELEAVSSSAKAEHQAALDRANILLLESQEALKIAQEDVERVKAEIALIECAEKVLGIKGVRATILSNALPGLEEVTNTWLSQLNPGVSVRLTPTEKNGVIEAVPLDINGVNGKGYKSTSGGERRRLDVALVLGLAEMASGVTIRDTNSTLFFDEVADSLDKDGLIATARIFHALATTRCVVLITHREELLDQLQPKEHWKVMNGSVTVERKW
jgi:DNA repair exonuclease SbcCD ATPase subunit